MVSYCETINLYFTALCCLVLATLLMIFSAAFLEDMVLFVVNKKLVCHVACVSLKL